MLRPITVNGEGLQWGTEYEDKVERVINEAFFLNVLNLPEFDGKAMRRSPQCGSSVTAYVAMDGDRIADFRQEVRACALGQASASVLGQAVIGRSRDETTSPERVR